MKLFFNKSVLLLLLSIQPISMRGDLDPVNVVEITERYRIDSIRMQTIDLNHDSKSSSIHASIEFDLIILNKQDVRVRIAHVYINQTGVERILEGRRNTVFDADILKELTMVVSRNNNIWRPRDPNPVDMPIGSDVVFSTIIDEALPLIFPVIPEDFTVQSGFKWSTDDGLQGEITYHGDPKVINFQVFDVYEFMNLYKVAVIKGDQRYVKTENEFMGATHRMVHIEYDVNSQRAINAFERFTRRQNFIFPPRGDSLVMGVTNILRIPK